MNKVLGESLAKLHQTDILKLFRFKSDQMNLELERKNILGIFSWETNLKWDTQDKLQERFRFDGYE